MFFTTLMVAASYALFPKSDTVLSDTLMGNPPSSPPYSSSAPAPSAPSAPSAPQSNPLVSGGGIGMGVGRGGGMGSVGTGGAGAGGVYYDTPVPAECTSIYPHTLAQAEVLNPADPGLYKAYT
ncbi:hypothetical protein B484DRAFT_447406 [Ochromonadaceae sp. CCMP2298]|nr:hypothetical protein B484DRAFT_447406 [Ochromonadaceae sp. CCMP2298]